MKMSTLKRCQLCDFATSSLPFYLKHLTIIHSSEPGFSIQCRLNGCTRTYNNIRTYKNHVYDRHSSSHSTTLHLPGCTAENTGNDTDMQEDIGNCGDDEFVEGKINCIVSISFHYIATRTCVLTISSILYKVNSTEIKSSNTFSVVSYML